MQKDAAVTFAEIGGKCAADAEVRQCFTEYGRGTNCAASPTEDGPSRMRG